MKPESLQLLTRYWFVFDGDPETIGLCRPGCGITAYNYEDALSILSNIVYPGVSVPEIKSVQENVDVSTLDQNHVVPNMGNCLKRGVWWPTFFTPL